MAKSHRSPAPSVLPVPPDPTAGQAGDRTGRYLVLFRDDSDKKALSSLKESAGLSRVASAADFEEGKFDFASTTDSDVMTFDKLGVAVVNVDPGQLNSIFALANEDNAILAVEPERIMFALGMPAMPMDEQFPALSGDFLSYLRGYRDAVNSIFEKATAGGPAGGMTPEAVANFADTALATWGLQATRVVNSQYTGQGVRLAILDTGLDLQHPDFAGRAITSQSFITGEAVQDGNKHGTHCAGTSSGPSHPAGIRRYGIASKAELFIGKVLSNAGSGADGGILAGINWAITNKCRIVSMSLGAPTQVGEPFSTIYENVARRALAANTLIIAAAGNESQRPGSIMSVDRPANCPSIMAVASLDMDLGVSFYSCGGLNPNGGGVDIAAPGRNVFSTVPMPRRYDFLSGTSMATPHVAGLAALHLQARGLNTSAAQLWQILTSTASRLSLLSRDVGSGLAQAP